MISGWTSAIQTDGRLWMLLWWAHRRTSIPILYYIYNIQQTNCVWMIVFGYVYVYDTCVYATPTRRLRCKSAHLPLSTHKILITMVLALSKNAIRTSLWNVFHARPKYNDDDNHDSGEDDDDDEDGSSFLIAFQMADWMDEKESEYAAYWMLNREPTVSTILWQTKLRISGNLMWWFAIVCICANVNVCVMRWLR